MRESESEAVARLARVIEAGCECDHGMLSAPGLDLFDLSEQNAGHYCRASGCRMLSTDMSNLKSQISQVLVRRRGA